MGKQSPALKYFCKLENKGKYQGLKQREREREVEREREREGDDREGMREEGRWGRDRARGRK